MANALIPDSKRAGRLLDIGCGSHPYFLSRTRFAEKLGVDRIQGPGWNSAGADLRLMGFDIDTQDALPFESASFDAVTMLAVFEHVRKDRLKLILDEIHRVLRPGGRFVMTTPAGWTGPLLRMMKCVRLVSAEEIEEHQDHYSAIAVRAVISTSALRDGRVRTGYFELGMNLWATVDKSD